MSALDKFMANLEETTGKSKEEVNEIVENEVDVDDDGESFGFHVTGDNATGLFAAITAFAQKNLPSSSEEE